MSASPPISVRPTDCCAPSCTDVTNSQVPGPQGPAGAAGTNGTDGVDAFTTTSAQFVMPAIAGTVNVAVAVSDWAAIGQVVYITGAGYMTVTATPDATHITVRNLGYTGNVAPTTIVASAQKVSPGGLIGPTGSSGGSTLNDLSPTTTKGDLIVDNGANNPLASDVRLAAGTDGQQLTSVAAQPTGLQWKTLQPNATTDNGIPRFDGTTGTPVPLQTSLVVITDVGAVQASGTGGNARGAGAVDLQVSRLANQKVASGTGAFIGAGTNNQASGTESLVVGGDTNIASGDSSAIAGGDTNTATSDLTFIGGGANNTANGDYGAVAGGSGNTAGNIAFVGGGLNNSASLGCSITGGSSNIASGTNAVIGAGSDNTASGNYSGILNGSDGLANQHGQFSHSSGKFTAKGDAQYSRLIYRGSTTNATPTEIFIDGSATKLVIPSDTTWTFRALIAARRTDVDDESAAYQLLGCIDRNGAVGTTALVGTVTKTVIAEDTAAWDIAATADNVNGGLVITVTGEIGKTIKWVCVMELTQVTG